MTYKLLIADDAADVAEVIAFGARMTWPDCQVTIANDGAQALNAFMADPPDLVVLDVAMPAPDGFEVCRRIRETSQVPILMLTVHDATLDKVRALDLGADDYLTKPFSLSELVARVKSIVRRKKFSGKQMIAVGNLDIHPEERTVTVAKEDLQLNRKEFAILMYFVANKDRLIHKTALAEHVWGDHVDESDNFEFIYSQIRNLRRKLNESKAGVEIQSVYGVGYKFIVE